MRPTFKQLRWLTLPLLLIGLLAAFAACSDDDEEPSDSGGKTATPGSSQQFDGTVKIGALQDLSGVFGGSGSTLSFIKGTQVAMDQLNANGGVKVGDKRYKLELIVVDSRSEPTALAAGADELIQDGVIAVIPPSQNFAQAYQQFSAAKVISQSVSPAATVFLLRDGADKHPYLFSSIEVFDPIIIGWVKQTVEQFPDIKSVAVAIDDTPLRVMTGSIQKAAQELGLEFKGEVAVPPETTDFAPFMTTVNGFNADLVYVATGLATPANTIKTAVDLDVAPYLMVPGMRPSEVDAVGNLRDTKVIMADWRLPFQRGLLVPPEYKEAVDQFGTLEGNRPVHVGWAMAHYDFMYLMKQAMEKAGTVTDTAAIAEALIGQVYDGPFGKSTVIANHTTTGSTGIAVATKDKFTVYIYNTAADFVPISDYSVDR